MLAPESSSAGALAAAQRRLPAAFYWPERVSAAKSIDQIESEAVKLADEQLLVKVATSSRLGGEMRGLGAASASPKGQWAGGTASGAERS